MPICRASEEFERRFKEHKKELSRQGGLWDRQTRPEFVESMARHAVRADIAKQVAFIPYEDFYQRELPRILADFQLDPAALGY